jgi:hypothetical protein
MEQIMPGSFGHEGQRQVLRPRPKAGPAGVVAAALVCAGNASATDPESRPTADYNAPEPGADLSRRLRAFANVSFQNWVIWQLSWFRGEEWTQVTRDSLADNLRQGFTYDRDELTTNFFGHPYHGGLTFNAARGAGLGFWESVPYTFIGSLSWEVFAENEPPSINDLLVTTLAGIMLGEITYRLSSELLDDGTSGGFRLLRELGAGAVSPMRGFNRLYTGSAWKQGPSPVGRSVEAAVHAGVERVRARGDPSSYGYEPTALLAADIKYGDLLPSEAASTLEPFEFFELYAAVSWLNSELDGAQIYTTGLLYGWSSDLSSGHGRVRDNNVFGLAMTYEFQGSNLATYGGVGAGPVDYVTLRLGHGRSLRLGLGADIVPILGVTPSEPRDGERGYNFGLGASLWGSAALDLNGSGEFRLRSRQYATTVVDGIGGIDYIGATRASYELNAVAGVGVGIAPMLIYRRRLEGTADGAIWQTQTQLYLRLRL